jgi:hypothetical protein
MSTELFFKSECDGGFWNDFLNRTPIAIKRID